MRFLCVGTTNHRLTDCHLEDKAGARDRTGKWNLTKGEKRANQGDYIVQAAFLASNFFFSLPLLILGLDPTSDISPELKIERTARAEHPRRLSIIRWHVPVYGANSTLGPNSNARPTCGDAIIRTHEKAYKIVGRQGTPQTKRSITPAGSALTGRLGPEVLREQASRSESAMAWLNLVVIR